MKKIRMITKDLNMNIDTHNEMVVTIDDVIFICSEECNLVDIMLGERDQGADHIDTIDNETTSRIVDLEDLKTFAVNWFFENVEVVKEYSENQVVIDEADRFIPEESANGKHLNRKESTTRSY
jgi:hypothetical protein